MYLICYVRVCVIYRTYVTIVLHLVQFGFLLSLGFKVIPFISSIVLLFLVVAVPALLLLARCNTTKHVKSLDWSYSSIKSPEQETDKVPDRVILLLSCAAMLEAAAYALFSISSIRNNDGEISDGGGFKSYETLTQVSADM